MSAMRAAAGQLRQVRQVGQLAEHDAHGLVEVVASSPGIDPTPVARGHAVGPASGEVEAMVHEPTTRVPS